jgi:AcrR family transcriptional regulator
MLFRSERRVRCRAAGNVEVALIVNGDVQIAAYVERADDAYREWFRTALDRGGDDPRERVRALFDEQNAMLQPEVCRGCPFLMVLTEFPDEKLASHQQAVRLKQWVHDQFVVLAEGLASDDPDRLAGSRGRPAMRGPWSRR